MRAAGLSRPKEKYRSKHRLSKKVCSPLGPLCEGAPPAGGGGENCAAARNISGYGKVLSLRPFGAPLPLWRKRHLPRIGGVCLAEGGFSTCWQTEDSVFKRSPASWPSACGRQRPAPRRSASCHSTSTTATSLTFVPVGPVMIRPPTACKAW